MVTTAAVLSMREPYYIDANVSAGHTASIFRTIALK
jgi:hypothetical protein